MRFPRLPSVRRVALAFGLALAVAPRSAHAEPAQSPGADPAATSVASTPTAASMPDTAKPRRWYGYQTLIADGAGVSLLLLGASNSSAYPELSATSAGFGIASLAAVPVLHVIHGNVGYGFASLGLRLVAPPLLAVLGFVVGGQLSGGYSRPNCDSFCFSQGARVGLDVGFVGGALGVMALDSAVFAYDERATSAAPAARTSGASGVSWRPTLGVHKDGSTVGVIGTF